MSIFEAIHDEHIDFSQQGNLYGSCANLLQIEHFSRAGMGPISLDLHNLEYSL